VSKAIYQRLFGWIIGRCNETLIDPEVDTSSLITLGLLDIFGFEDFKHNSLEQMCINITNEQLQWYFNNFIFAMEQEEYKREGIDFGKIVYDDNQPTLDMFLKKPTGILPLLDEESRFPKADDKSFTDKLQVGTRVLGVVVGLCSWNLCLLLCRTPGGVAEPEGPPQQGVHACAL
jgi:myosin-3